VDDSKDSWMGYNDKSRTDLSIQMLFGSEGFETISLEAIPLRRRAGLPMIEDCVFARIPLRYLRDLMIGLDVRFPWAKLLAIVNHAAGYENRKHFCRKHFCIVYYRA
jgi:hypothetical protein